MTSRDMDALTATPSKLRVRVYANTPSQQIGTPKSTSKRRNTDSFLTPSTRRFNAQCTPSSHTSKFSATPEFLKRGGVAATSLFPSATISSGDGFESLFLSPIAVRKPPRIVGRGLSDLVKGLRAIEEEKLDEELDILREMEEEVAEEGPFGAWKVKSAMQHSQLIDKGTDLPLGPDGEGFLSEDNPSQEGLTRDDSQLKIWKKKGQKRTTKKVKIRPNTQKWAPEPEWKERDAEVEDEGVVQETQLLEAFQQNDNDEITENDDLESDEDIQSKSKSKKSKIETDKPKSKKKVSATVHANFRALKIKNKNSKGKGRFGRGRRR